MPPFGVTVADCLTRDTRLIEEYHGSEVAAELLGAADTAAVKKLVTDLGASGDSRAQVITLVLLLGALKPVPRGSPGTNWLT